MYILKFNFYYIYLKINFKIIGYSIDMISLLVYNVNIRIRRDTMCSDGNEIFRQCDCGKTYVTSSYATISGDNLSRLCCGFCVLASMLDNEKDLVSVSFVY